MINNAAVQEKAVREYHEKLWGYIQVKLKDEKNNKDVTSYLNTTINGDVITKEALIGGAHLVGAGGLVSYITSNGKVVPGDGNNVKVSSYIKLLKNTTISSDSFNNNAPVSANISSVFLNTTTQEIFDFGKNIFDFKSNGLINDTYYTNISKIVSSYLINSDPTSNYSNLVNSGYFDNSILNPIKIGAFYESTTNTQDNSTSIAQKTFKLLNSSNQTITKNQLNTLDLNQDGKLSGTEISSLKTWKDLNEDGIAQAGEITSLTEIIYSKDYDTFTKGNSIFQSSITPTQAVKQSSSYITPTSNYSAVSIPASNYVSIVKSVSVPIVPNSNFASLRANDNVYVINSVLRINWSANQVKINNSNRTYMIGTNGNDSFDYRYYAQYSSWFNVNILRNFLGGAGDDSVGGSNYADNIWGGIGNDTLYGYDGDDSLYGEEGNDVLLGQNGNDKLFGGAGNDVMYGHMGNDSLYGGIGNDELHGNKGNDILVGEAGDDKIFGEVGNDTIYGGDGNDVISLVKFISLNNRFYQAKFFDLDLRNVA